MCTHTTPPTHPLYRTHLSSSQLTYKQTLKHTKHRKPHTETHHAITATPIHSPSFTQRHIPLLIQGSKRLDTSTCPQGEPLLRATYSSTLPTPARARTALLGCPPPQLTTPTSRNNTGRSNPFPPATPSTHSSLNTRDHPPPINCTPPTCRHLPSSSPHLPARILTPADSAQHTQRPRTCPAAPCLHPLRKLRVSPGTCWANAGAGQCPTTRSPRATAQSPHPRSVDQALTVRGGRARLLLRH